jgi:hypothetical protein
VTHNFARTLILTACFAAIVTLPAGAVSFDSLIGSTEGSASSLTVGDINFYNFELGVSCGNTGVPTGMCQTLINDGAIAGILSATDPGGELTVNGVSNAAGDGFTINGGITTYEFDGAATTLDLSLTYDAAIIGPVAPINDVYLEATDALNPPCNPPAPCPSVPSVLISETVTNGSSPFNQVGFLQVNDPPPVFTDMIDLTQNVNSVSVLKDIDLDSGAGVGDYANTTSITQQLSQTPEPRAYAAVLGLFFALFFVIKRRGQQTA